MPSSKLKFLYIDFCPQWSARARRTLYSPLGVLVAAVLVACLCGLVIHPRVFVLAGGLLAVIVVGIAWPWLVLRVVSAIWQTPPVRISEGETVRFTVVIRNPLFMSVPGLSLVVDREKPVALGRIAARREVLGTWAVTPRLRGIYPKKLLLQTSFPFGLWTATKSIAVPTPVIVWPRILPVGAMPSDTEHETIDGHVERPRVGTAGDLLGVRPYRRGDSPRRIHWRQSARHDRLIVCELQSTLRPRIMIVVDLDPKIHTPGPDGTAEWSIRIAASLASGWLAQGAIIGLAIGDQIIPPASGVAQRFRILDTLAAADHKPLSASIFFEGLVIRITTDAQFAVNRRDRRMLLCTGGFGETCTGQNAAAEAANKQSPGMNGCGATSPAQTRQAWLVIEDAASIPRQLRSGWTEARHG